MSSIVQQASCAMGILKQNDVQKASPTGCARNLSISLSGFGVLKTSSKGCRKNSPDPKLELREVSCCELRIAFYVNSIVSLKHAACSYCLHRIILI